MTRAIRTSAAIAIAAFLISLLGPAVWAEKPDEGEPKPAPVGPQGPPGFVTIPTGVVHPGCTLKDYMSRANDERSRQLYIFDVWGNYKDPITIPAYAMQRYGVTNAQWKLYLDRNFAITVKTNGQQTLKGLAEKHIRHLDEPIEGQWMAIYALNWKPIYAALKDATKPLSEEDKKAGKTPERLWDPAWTPANPSDKLALVHLPEGLELRFYEHPVPKHWYGWNRLSGLSSGVEYADARAAPKDAFIVPDDEVFKKARLRAKDFRNYPMRDIAPVEALEFAEWAGCSLPTEYEFERAARGDKPNTRQQPGPSKWVHGKQPGWFAYVENGLCRDGPLAVDDASVAKGDSDFGIRHLLGNTWTLTSTFWDHHPYRSPKPDTAITGGNFNYALIAKGGAYGSGYRQIQISTRTGMIGTAVLDLKFRNRADSLGLRLVHHPQPGYDLMNHTIRRMAFNSRLGMWQPPPHGFAMSRMTGADETHFVASDAENGYTHVQKKAKGIAFAPYWASRFNASVRKSMADVWRNKKKPKSDAIFLGVLRSDVPMRAGLPWNIAAWQKVNKERKEHAKWAKELKKLRGKKREAHEANEPANPPPPDIYEAATVKQRETAGVWHEGTLGPGEWNVVYWYGFIGLVGRAKRMPPEAIFLLDKKTGVTKTRRVGEGKASLTLDPAGNKFELRFLVEEEKNPKKPQMPPREQDSDLWALCQVLPNGWPGRKVNNLGWQFSVSVPTPEGALQNTKWNTTPAAAGK
ncbi:MAG: SUMF1/EgtB/PvdO family nonheme iron enzyme [Planctomycetota bacterium]